MNMEVPHMKKNISIFVPNNQSGIRVSSDTAHYGIIKNLLLGIKFYMSVLVYQFHLIVRYVIIVCFG